MDGLNLYRYSRDNPINFSDPGGTESESVQSEELFHPRSPTLTEDELANPSTDLLVEFAIESGDIAADDAEAIAWFRGLMDTTDASIEAAIAAEEGDGEWLRRVQLASEAYPDPALAMQPEDFSDEFYLKLEEIANELGAKPGDILLAFLTESNLNPYSRLLTEKGAVGLFQMTDPALNISFVEGDKPASREEAVSILSEKGPEYQLELFKAHVQRSKPRNLKLDSALAIHATVAGGRAASRLATAQEQGIPLENVPVFEGVSDTMSMTIQSDGFNDRQGAERENAYYQGNKAIDKNKDGMISMAEFDRFSIRGRGGTRFRGFMARYNEVTSR